VQGDENGGLEAVAHQPVLLGVVLELLDPARGGVYVDATLGGGSYSEALLRASDPSGRVIAIDRDDAAIESARARLSAYSPRIELVHGSFADLAAHLDRLGVERVQGIVADLGLSSLQLDDPERGFSFRHDGPLDMRFDRSRGPTAADLVNEMSERELRDILSELGEERYASRIARRLVARRPIRTTKELRSAVVSVLGPLGSKRRGIDPATRTFQALRIAVNRELEALDAFLALAPGRLAPEGRLVVLSYHSLEDRAVKLRFRALARNEEEPRYRVLTKKPVTPGAAEIAWNRRARSAKLRALECLS
jgi:16S rRNA (cytosine1402-N4)-methyltransferase